MSELRVVGLTPWLPGSLGRSAWWTEPVRAERLAALRIGVAVVLLADIVATYLPRLGDFFGPGSLGSPEVFARAGQLTWRWSILRGVEEPWVFALIFALWLAAGVGLLIGFLPRLCAAVAWCLSLSVVNANFYLHNSGDNVRTILLLYLMVSPCGAVWTWRRQRTAEATYTPAWPVRLLLIQLGLIYFMNGVYKMSGGDWRDGSIMHYVMANAAWTRVSFAQFPLPLPLLQAMTWTVLLWELGFPLLMLMRPVRTPALCLGVFFHLGTAAGLQIAAFPFYMLCLYLPLVPWENRKATDETRMKHGSEARAESALIRA